ncbi:MAG TPA: GNAT family N-acetyltransferase [Burkholderiaceae bacterium]|nr:GNAT family N-acetyltransferase [Burkholderiaceae bacterium]
MNLSIGPTSADDGLEVRVVDDLTDIDAAQWNRLLDEQSSPTPFMRHEYLLALQASLSAVARTGWGAAYLTASQGSRLAAALPLYLKGHSYGEYVFDWAWADAYERHGLEYYPKLLAAVPFTPVPGSRMLARDDSTRRALLRAAISVAREQKLSSVHLLFMDDDERAAAEAEGWLIRGGVQFHWENRADSPYASFEEFVASLQREKRKKIGQERRRVSEAGVSFTVHEGDGIDRSLWSFFYRCYTLTYRAHGSTPYLTRDFFDRMASKMPGNWVMFVAHRRGTPIAASLVAVDPQRRAAFGRYWGAVEHVPLLHFEACYYQPLQWCIEHGYQRFEGGAQGEHKMARGLLPVRTHSAHWLAHPRFADAVAEFLKREGAGIDAYVDELRERNPFKVDSSN